MATLNADHLVQVRQALEKEGLPIAYTKAQISAAAQAIEDTFENARPTVNAAINAATSPLVLPPSVKSGLVRWVLLQKFTRGA